MLNLPTTPAEIKQAHEQLKAEIAQHEAAIKLLKGHLSALQHICQHPNLERWHSNPMGRWPTDHQQCKDCGYYRET